MTHDPYDSEYGRKHFYDRLSAKRIAQEAEAERLRLEQEVQEEGPPPAQKFQTNELSFARPSGLKDKTFHVFTQTDIDVSPFNFVIGRSRVEEGIDLETMAQQLLSELQNTLGHLEWVEPLAPAEVAGLEARRVGFSWRQQGVPVHQVQVMFLHHDEHLQPLLIQLTGTSNNPRGMTLEERAQFDELINSVELRLPPSPPAQEQPA